MFPKVRGGLLSVPLEAHPDVPPPSSIAAEPSGFMEDRPSAPQVLLYRPILQGGPPLNEALRVRRIGLCFFFSFELSYLRAPKNPRLAGAPEVGTQLSQEPLAVRTVLVQNGT